MMVYALIRKNIAGVLAVVALSAASLSAQADSQEWKEQSEDDTSEQVDARTWQKQWPATSNN